MAKIVLGRRFGALKPVDGVSLLALSRQVTADIVVSVSSFRIDGNGLFAFLDCLVETELKTIGPASKGVGLGGRTKRDGFGIEINRSVQIAVLVVVLSFLAKRDRLFSDERIAHVFGSTGTFGQASSFSMPKEEGSVWIKGRDIR